MPFPAKTPLHALILPVFSSHTHRFDLMDLSPAQALALLQQEIYTPLDERWRRPWILPRLQTEEILRRQAKELMNHLVQVLPLLRVRFGPLMQECTEQESPLWKWLSQAY
jgi:hypothetical protein